LYTRARERYRRRNLKSLTRKRQGKGASALDQLSLEAVVKARVEVKEDNRAIDMLEEIGRGEDPLKK